MGFWLVVSVASLAWAETPPSLSPSPSAANENKIEVTLFGQPCVLSGGVDRPTLVAVHSISPEKIPPIQSSEEAKQSLQTLRAAPPLPTLLDSYREQLSKRLLAQAAFSEAFEAAKKSGISEKMVQNLQPFILAEKLAGFRAALTKIKAKPSAWTRATQDEINDAYIAAIPAHPEEEFHRAIGRLKVRYACSFEESDTE